MNHSSLMPLDLAQKKGHKQIIDVLVTEATRCQSENRARQRESFKKWLLYSLIAGMLIWLILWATGAFSGEGVRHDAL